MIIGLPKALLFYRYGILWKTFFEELGCEALVSGDTDRQTLSRGISHSVGECCLPLKAYLGHVHSLLGRCDRILVPRFECMEKGEEYCVRFWGLPDIVRGTYPEALLLTYNHRGQKPDNEQRGFLRMGRELGKTQADALRAYRHARLAQRAADAATRKRQLQTLQEPGIKVLVAAQPYLIHDAYLGGVLVRMIREQGAVPLFSDRCDPAACRRLSKTLSRDLYWTINKEIIGAIPLLRREIDGVILVSAFPCGTDSLVNELVLRRVRGLPLTQMILDEHQGEAGMQTRVESFLDILAERRRIHAS